MPPARPSFERIGGGQHRPRRRGRLPTLALGPSTRSECPVQPTPTAALGHPPDIRQKTMGPGRLPRLAPGPYQENGITATIHAHAGNGCVPVSAWSPGATHRVMASLAADQPHDVVRGSCQSAFTGNPPPPGRLANAVREAPRSASLRLPRAPKKRWRGHDGRARGVRPLDQRAKRANLGVAHAPSQTTGRFDGTEGAQQDRLRTM